MITMRRNVFETNSSSSHSLVVSNKDRGYSYDLPVDEEGILTIPFGEFGWGPEILKTPIEKLSYFITDHAPYIEDDDKMDWDKLIKLVLQKSEDIRDAIEIVKSNCPQVKEVKFEKCDEYWPLGYVDHQSCGTSNDAASIEDLIFNNSVLILIDNDNSCSFEDYKPWYNYSKQQHIPSKKSKEKLFDLSINELLYAERENH